MTTRSGRTADPAVRSTAPRGGSSGTPEPTRSTGILNHPIAAFVAFLMLLTSASCGDAGRDTRAANRRVRTYTLQGHILTESSLTLGLPSDLAVIGDKLIVEDDRAEFAVFVLDSEDGTLLEAAGPEGSGPGEFVSPQGISKRPGHPDEFWVYDARLNRMIRYDLSTLLTGRRQSQREPLQLPGLLMRVPRWLDDSTLVAINPSFAAEDGRFALFDVGGESVADVGAPPPGDASIPVFIRQQAYGGDIAAHPERAVFVMASAYAGRLEVYSRDGRLLRSMAVPEPFEPDYSAASDGFNLVRGPDFRFGYISVAATADHVYALWSGRVAAEYSSYDWHKGREVHVFDWAGGLVATLRLDSDAFALAVDADEARLYVSRLLPSPAILAYELPALPPKRGA